MHTIRVVPQYAIRFPDGREHSPFSASAADPGAQMIRKGWTWEVTDVNGCTTQGLGRVPASSRAEAILIAGKYAEATGATMIPMDKQA